MGILFLIAQLVEKKPSLHRFWVNNPVIYSLSLCIYCTAWTFYGSVGMAATSGMLFLGVYIGPTLVAVFWWVLLRKMVRIKTAYRITTIADFIAARYDKSQRIATLVTLIAFISILPYIALQLKAILSTFNIVTGQQTTANAWIEQHMAFLVVGFLTVFTIMFGLRRLDPTERHKGIVAVIAVESLVKLIVFLIGGGFVVFFLFNGVHDVLHRFQQTVSYRAALAGGNPNFTFVTWITHILLSMSAVLFLPRQFHVAVVENVEEKHIRTAMWLFPAYMFLINILVYPVALAGLLKGLPINRADSFQLLLPMRYGSPWLALLVFIGGFSAATSMIMVCSMTIATMFTNHMVLPLAEHLTWKTYVHRNILKCRWVFVACFITLGYILAQSIGESYMLVNIGLIAFAGILQFAPVIIGGIFWQRMNKHGAFMGLLAGFITWLYTSMVPAFVKSGWLPQSILEKGPWGFGFLHPEHLVGITVLPPLAHSVFWSLLMNIGFYVCVSLYTETSENEKRISESFVNILKPLPVSFSAIPHKASLSMREKSAIIKSSLANYFSGDAIDGIIRKSVVSARVEGKESLSVFELAELQNEVEKMLAGSLGTAMAHKIIAESSLFTEEENKELAEAYSLLLVRLKLTPAELKKTVNYYEEKEKLLAEHAGMLKVKVEQLNAQVVERKKAEQRMFKLNECFLNFGPDPVTNIKNITNLCGEFFDGGVALYNRIEKDTIYAVGQWHVPAGYKEVDIAEGHICYDVFVKEGHDAVVVIQDLQASSYAESDVSVRRYGLQTYIGKAVKFAGTTIGSLCVVFQRAFSPTEEDKKIISILASAIGVEEKRYHSEKALQESEQKFRMLFNTANDAIIIMDAGRLVDCNLKAPQVFGCLREQMVGKSLQSFIVEKPAAGKELRPSLSGLMRAAMEGHPQIFEGAFCRTDGTAFDAEVSLNRIELGGSVFLQAILHDLTERKKIEKLKDDFVNTVSHELRTPLTTIKEGIEIIMNDSVGSINEEQKDVLDTAKRNVDRLTRLINGILDVQKLQSEMMKFEKRPEHIDVLAEEVITMMVPLAKRKNLEFQVDLGNVGRPVFVDRDRIIQVMLNLMSNAIKFTERGTVSLVTRQVSDSLVQVSVGDTGIGIKDEDKDKLFQSFSQLETVDHGMTSGTGLGLVICKEIVQQHGGKIWVESEFGKGSRFCFVVPCMERI